MNPDREEDLLSKQLDEIVPLTQAQMTLSEDFVPQREVAQILEKGKAHLAATRVVVETGMLSSEIVDVEDSDRLLEHTGALLKVAHLSQTLSVMSEQSYAALCDLDATLRKVDNNISYFFTLPQIVEEQGGATEDQLYKVLDAAQEAVKIIEIRENRDRLFIELHRDLCKFLAFQEAVPTGV